jgi:hypothetical protein
MPTESRLLSLPRELRDEIYRHYFALDGGLHFNVTSGKLTASDSSTIDFPLRRSCRQIAHE